MTSPERSDFQLDIPLLKFSRKSEQQDESRATDSNYLASSSFSSVAIEKTASFKWSHPQRNCLAQSVWHHLQQIRWWYSLTGTDSTKYVMASGLCCQIDVHTVTQSSPSAGISFTHSLPGGSEVWRITDSVSPDGHSDSSSTNSTKCEALKDVHFSARLMEDFLALASDNTNENLETCGLLGAFLKEGTFYVTSLIIPKQESTSSSCQALNEEQIFTIQSEQSLFPIGWIHTHPTQSCFMSSVDLHTHYSYQVMVPEAVAIVIAPTDKSRRYGIFRLSDPVGMSILKDCREKGFHPHTEPADGGSLYVECCNVYINSNLRLEVYDLR